MRKLYRCLNVPCKRVLAFRAILGEESQAEASPKSLGRAMLPSSSSSAQRKPLLFDPRLTLSLPELLASSGWSCCLLLRLFHTQRALHPSHVPFIKGGCWLTKRSSLSTCREQRHQ